MNSNYQLLISKINEFTQKFYLNKLLRGIIYTATCMLGMYIALFLLVYYAHPDVAIKTILFFSFILLSFAALFFWIIRPGLAYFRLSKNLSIEEAASLIGDHFFNVKDKLLNTLQLKMLADQSPDNNQLILAGIDQKITELKPVPFTSAIRLKDNRKYLKYFLAPFSIIVLIAFIAPTILREGSYSFIQYNTEILPKAPFEFQLLNKTLTITQGDDINLLLKLKGNELPQEVYLTEGVNTYKLDKDNTSRFHYTIRNIQKTKELRFSAGGFQSAGFSIVVTPRPSLLNMSASYQYPSYLNRKNETVQNVSDMMIPEGTRITWKLKTENASSMVFTIDKKSHLLPVDDNISTFNAVLRKSAEYKITPQNRYTSPTDSLTHQIAVIADQFPVVSVIEMPDSLSSKALYFSGSISDDYGFSFLKFHYNIKDQGKKIRSVSKSIPIKTNLPENTFFHFWNLNDSLIKPGQVIEYYFEVADNDEINGAKKTRSPLKTYQLPTSQQIAGKINETSASIKQKMENAIKLAETVEKESKKMGQSLLDKKQLTLDDKKHIDELLDKRAQLEKAIEDIKKLNEKNSFEKGENQPLKQELAEKQKQIDDLFNNVLNEKTKALLEQLQNLIDQNNKEQTQNDLSKMQIDNKSLKNELDRILELYKQLEFEQTLQNNIDRLNELAKKQNDLSKLSNDKSTSATDLKNKQKDLSKQFEGIKKDLESLDNKNQELEHPNPFKTPDKEVEEIDHQQEESEKQLEQNNKQKAAQNQQKAGEQMQQIAQKMEQMQQQSEETENNVNALELRKLLENLLTTSFEQEKVMISLSRMNSNDPLYTSNAQKQRIIKDNMKTISDSLYSLSKRVPQIETAVNEEMQKINFNIDKSLEELGERRTPEANKHQQYAMTSVNNLALMLNEALEQLQNMMKNAKGGGKSKNQSMQQLQKMQQELNKRMQQARDQMQKSGNQGAVPKEKMSEEFARMAQQQQMIREALQKVNQEENKGGQGKLGNLNQTIQDMKKTETELVNKRLEQETLNRQKEVLTKLLDAQNAEREQDEDVKRESKAGKDFPPSYNQMLEKFKKQKQNETEWLQKFPPDMNYYYKNKIAEYFKLLNSHP